MNKKIIIDLYDEIKLLKIESCDFAGFEWAVDEIIINMFPHLKNGNEIECGLIDIGDEFLHSHSREAGYETTMLMLDSITNFFRRTYDHLDMLGLYNDTGILEFSIDKFINKNALILIKNG